MEELNLKIKLSSNATDICPVVRILLDDKEYFSGPVFGEETVEFDAEIDDDFTINVEFAGNDPRKLILDSDGMPTNSVTITISELSIEGVNITEIAYDKSTFTIDSHEKYIEEYTINQCLDFGHKGMWTLPIESPVYIWILENL